MYSWVVTHQPYAPDLAELVPYTVAWCGSTSRTTSSSPASSSAKGTVYQGLPVRAVPERVNDEIGLLHWEAATVIGMQVTRR